METKELLMTIVFSIFGSLVCFSLFLLLACYCYQKQRRKRQLDDDNESLQSILQDQQKQYQNVVHAKKPLLRNGFFSFKTLNRTRSLEAQLDASVSASLASLPLPVAPSSASPVPQPPLRAAGNRRASDFHPTRPSTPLQISSSTSRTTGVMPLSRPVSTSASSMGITGAGSSSSRPSSSGGSSAACGAVGGPATVAGATGTTSAAGGVGAAQMCDKSASSNPQNKSLATLKTEHPSTAFWQNRSISLVDMYIDNSEPTENVGQIQFSLEYDFDNSTLILKIMQSLHNYSQARELPVCTASLLKNDPLEGAFWRSTDFGLAKGREDLAKEIPAKDMSGTSDPYVRVTLLPDKKHRLETKIKRRTLHPRWNETFYFEGFPIQKLQSRVLHLHVFDYDRFSRDDSIGEVFLPLCQVDFSDKPVFWKALKPPLKDKCGELLISLCYHPTNSTLTLTALKARNLKAKDINGKSDPYVKVWLQFGDKRVEKRKTPVYKCTLEPVFNETFTFDVPWEKIRECSLDIRVMDFDNIGRNELIGRILLAAKNSTGASETKHWQDMIAKPRQAVVQWHRLKPE